MTQNAVVASGVRWTDQISLRVLASSVPRDVIVRRAVSRAAFLPEQREQVTAAIRADITRKQNLNPERRHRTCPRVVKRARHNSYRVKKTGDRGVRHSNPPTIKLANLGPASSAT